MTRIADEIDALNQAWLSVAQRVAQRGLENGADADAQADMLRLGLSREAAEVLARLSPEQIAQAARSNLLLCRIDFAQQAARATPVHNEPPARVHSQRPEGGASLAANEASAAELSGA